MRVAIGNLFEHVQAVAKDTVTVGHLPTHVTFTLAVTHTVIDTRGNVLLDAEGVSRRDTILVVLRAANICYAHHGTMVLTCLLNINNKPTDLIRKL